MTNEQEKELERVYEEFFSLIDESFKTMDDMAINYTTIVNDRKYINEFKFRRNLYLVHEQVREELQKAINSGGKQWVQKKEKS